MEIATDAGWDRAAREASERADTAAGLAQELNKQHAHGLVIALAVGWITAEEATAAAESLLKIDLRLSGATYPEERFAALQELRAWSVAAVRAENREKHSKTEPASKRVFVRSGAVFLTGTVRAESLRVSDTDNVEVTLSRILGEKHPESRSVTKTDLIIEPEAEELHVPVRVAYGVPVFRSTGSFGVVCHAADPPNHQEVMVLWYSGNYSWCNLTDLRVPKTEGKRREAPAAQGSSDEEGLIGGVAQPAPGVEAATAPRCFEPGDFVFVLSGVGWHPARVVSGPDSLGFWEVRLMSGQTLVRRNGLLPMCDEKLDTLSQPSFAVFKTGDRVFDMLGSSTGIVIADAAEVPMWNDRCRYAVTWVTPATGRVETVVYAHAELAGYHRVVAKSAPRLERGPAPIPWACTAPPSVNDRVFVWEGHGAFSVQDVIESSSEGIRTTDEENDGELFTDWRNCIRVPRRAEGRLETVAVEALEQGDIVYGNDANPDEPGIVTGIIRYDNSQEFSLVLWRSGNHSRWGRERAKTMATRSVPIGWVEKRVR